MRSLRSTLTHCCMFSLKQLTHTRSDGSDGSRLTQTTPRPETSPASDIKHNQHPPTREYQVGPRRLDKFRQDNFMEGGRTARWMVGLCNDEVNAGVCNVEAKAWQTWPGCASARTCPSSLRRPRAHRTGSGVGARRTGTASHSAGSTASRSPRTTASCRRRTCYPEGPAA